jgi:hypothetical protein
MNMLLLVSNEISNDLPRQMFVNLAMPWNWLSFSGARIVIDVVLSSMPK